MQEFFEWLNTLRNKGLICDFGLDCIRNFTSKKSIVDAFLNAKGAGFLCDKYRSGCKLDYSVINKYFSNFMNGKYVSIQKAKNSIEYTSEFWCDYRGDIIVGSTLVTLLGVRGTVNIEDNSAVTLYVDECCDIIISCPETSVVVCEYWGEKPRATEDSIVNFVKK